MSIKKSQVFAGVIENNGNYFPIPNRKLQKKLEPGVYTTHFTQDGQLYFEPISTNCDDIIDLPSPEYQHVMYDIETFLKPATKQAFNDYGFLYKRSALLWGPPGCGKTVIVNRIINTVIEQGGVILFDPDPSMLPMVYSVLEDIQPETLTLVVFEEFDDLVDDYESELLSLLDGEVQKTNVMYLATTNYKEDIPSRILRPGRFSSLIEVKGINLKARQAYLAHKGLSLQEATEWADKTEDFTVDELKEIVLSVKCLNYPFDTVLKRVQEYKKSKDTTDEKAVKASAEFHESQYGSSILDQINNRIAELGKPSITLNKPKYR